MASDEYRILIEQAKAITEGIPHLTANLANISSLIYNTLPDINWAGFYISQGGKLILGPFQGQPACVEIPYGKGVCGTAALKDETQLVPDVHRFPGHIACDVSSRSEIVIPLHSRGMVVAVLDIDSPIVSRFTKKDRMGLEALVAVIEGLLF